MKKIVLTLSCVILIISSCKERTTNIFCDKFEEITDKNNPVELMPQVIISEDSLLVPDDVTVIEDKILITSLDNKEAVFHLYNLEGEMIATFGNIGKAETEFTYGTMVTNQIDRSSVYVNDVNTCALKVLNLDSVIQSKHCVITKTIRTAPRTLNAFCVNDTLLMYEQETFDNYRLCSKNIAKSINYPSIDLYKSNSKPSNVYQSKMAFNEDKGIIVAAMRNSNQVNFYGIKSGDRHAIKISRDKIPLQKEFGNGHEFYCDITSNSRYVFALYMNQSSDDAYEKKKNMEIYVFDWDGNYIKSLETKEYINKISVDKENKWLYALDLDGNIYRYSLKDM